MGLYKNTTGVLTPIAGRGKAEYGASHYESGTVQVTTNEQGTVVMTITFANPMPDIDYVVNIASKTAGSSNSRITKTTTGFSCNINATPDTLVNVDWQAFKLYTDTEYNELLNSKVKVLKIPVASITIAPNDYDTLVSYVSIPSDSIIVGVMTELGGNVIVTPQKIGAGVFRVLGANPSPSVSYTYAGYVYVSYI